MARRQVPPTKKPELIVTIYVNEKSQSFLALQKFMEANLTEINKRGVRINFVAVTAKNSADLRRRGITHTPTMEVKDKLVVSLEKIISELQPPRTATDPTYGVTSLSPEESVQNLWFDEIVKNRADESDDRELRREEIASRMAALQARRPQIEGMPRGASVIPGGRKIVAKNVPKDFADDESFAAAAGTATKEETPALGYYDDREGGSILEEYYNSQADLEGRKPPTKPRRRPVE